MQGYHAIAICSSLAIGSHRVPIITACRGVVRNISPHRTFSLFNPDIAGAPLMLATTSVASARLYLAPRSGWLVLTG